MQSGQTGGKRGVLLGRMSRRISVISAAAALSVLLLCTGCSRPEPLFESMNSSGEFALSGTDAEKYTVPETEDTVPAAAVQETEERVTVFVCGAVECPGVYDVPSDARVVDAVAAAGGFSAGADREWHNLARRVSDGERLRILTEEEADLLRQGGMTSEEGYSGSASSEDADMPVNINTAPLEILMTLPGIGESRARAILDYRNRNGAFASTDELRNVSGIGDKLYERIAGRVTV